MNQELENRYNKIDWKRLIDSLRKARHYASENGGSVNKGDFNVSHGIRGNREWISSESTVRAVA